MNQEEKQELSTVITELAETDKELYSNLSSYSFIIDLLKFSKKVDNLSNTPEIYQKIKHYFGEYLEKPKFISFPLVDKRYKKYADIFTEEYILKLIIRKISSNFYSLEDYRNPAKWREFINRKENEYKQLFYYEYPRYRGTFEEYLQENSRVTYEYLRDGFSSTKYKEIQESKNTEEYYYDVDYMPNSSMTKKRKFKR